MVNGDSHGFQAQSMSPRGWASAAHHGWGEPRFVQQVPMLPWGLRGATLGLRHNQTYRHKTADTDALPSFVGVKVLVNGVP